MWITERNGKYIFQERYKDPVTGKYKTLSVTRDKMTSRVRKEAQATLDAKWDETRSGGNLKLSAVNERYLKYMKENVKEQTYMITKELLEKLEKILSDPPIDNLTAGYIKDRLSDKLDKPQTRNVYINKAKSVIRWAYQNDYTENIKCAEKLALFPCKKHVKIEDKYLETDEQKKIIAAANVEHHRLTILFLLLSGCRIGELAALNMADIDFNKGTIRINKTYCPKTKKTDTAKTAAGMREIRMQPELRALCREIRSWTLKQRLIHSLKGDAAFLLNDNGRRICINTFEQWFARNTESVLGRRLTPHALRHTHVSVLAAQDVPLPVISRRLGHENSDITKKIYYHVMEMRKKKDFDVLDKVSIL